MSANVFYRGVDVTAATLAELGAGQFDTGYIRYENGREYILVKNGTAAAGTLADGVICTAAISQTTTAASELKVLISSNVALNVVCANNTGAVVPGDHYFWGIIKGRGYCLGGAAIGDGVEMVPHTTDGAVGPLAVGATDNHLGFTISDVTTTVDNAVFWDLPGKHAGA